jgi:hypothetical protein
MRISIQACVEDEDSPRVLSIGCVERDAGVDPASGSACSFARHTKFEQADEFVSLFASRLDVWPADADRASGFMRLRGPCSPADSLSLL